MTGRAQLLEEARRHVAEGAAVLSRQRAVIKRLKRQGLDTAGSEQMLSEFEITQEIFEADLSRLEHENE